MWQYLREKRDTTQWAFLCNATHNTFMQCEYTAIYTIRLSVKNTPLEILDKQRTLGRDKKKKIPTENKITCYNRL